MHHPLYSDWLTPGFRIQNGSALSNIIPETVLERRDINEKYENSSDNKTHGIMRLIPVLR